MPERPEGMHQEILPQLPALNAFARHFYRGQADVDDLVQETLVRAIANIERFQEGTELKSWLFTIMRNSFCKQFAIAKREPLGLEDCVEDTRACAPSQEWIAMAHEVERVYNFMPECYRQVLDAVVIQGMSYKTTAEEMGCRIGTVKSRLNRARSYFISQFGTLDG